MRYPRLAIAVTLALAQELLPIARKRSRRRSIRGSRAGRGARVARTARDGYEARGTDGARGAFGITIQSTR